MRVLLVSSEVAGFAKTGGLADVAAALPRALSERGVECTVLMPLYHAVRHGKIPVRDLRQRFDAPVGARTVRGGLWQAQLPNSHVNVWLVEQPEYFERDRPTTGAGLYQYASSDGQLRDYADNCERFVFFCRAALEAVARLDWWPDVMHVNDWQTGLIPVYLKELPSSLRGPVRAKYAQIRTVLTVHNLAYQGTFWHLDMPLLGLPWRLFTPEALEFYGHINFLKAGLVYADRLTTVSPTYAREIQTPYFGCGLHGVLVKRSDKLTGIVNGIDERVWDPAADGHLPRNYGVDSVEHGKAACKAALQDLLEFEPKPDVPLLGMVSRLASQKGFDLLEKVLPELLQTEVQVVMLGEGDKRYRDMLVRLANLHPQRLAARFAMDESLAHLIEGGADAFLMPSQYEPCGLSQLYSLRYGTIPIVRATGGLADTVVDATRDHLAAGTATGFTFVPYTPAALRHAIDRALHMYRHDCAAWHQLRQAGMRKDWSWRKSAGFYEQVYSQALATL